MFVLKDSFIITYQSSITNDVSKYDSSWWAGLGHGISTYKKIPLWCIILNYLTGRFGSKAACGE